MSDHERKINDDAGLSDGGNAVVRPDTVRAKAHVPPVTLVIHDVVQAQRADNVELTVVPAPTTTMGYVITKTFTIHETEAVNGVIQYELLEDGKVAWVGTGDDRVDGLLKVILHITGEEPEIPDN